MSHDMFLPDSESDRRNYELAKISGRQYDEWDTHDFPDYEFPAWRDQAACQGKGDLFFPARGDANTAMQAKLICRTCPVIQECLAYAVANPDLVGIWGGKSWRQRKDLRTEKARPRPPCGTNSGWRSHQWYNEDVCAACKHARNVWQRTHRARRRGLTA